MVGINLILALNLAVATILITPGLLQLASEASRLDTSQARSTSCIPFDQKFILDIVRLHTRATEISKLALAKAPHPQLRQFARHTIRNRNRVYQQFSKRLRSWYGIQSSQPPSLTGGNAVKKLETLYGKDFEIEYIRLMITHHQEAVSLSKIAESTATHAELRGVASNIVRNESYELEMLRDWSKTWYELKQ